MCFVTFLFFSFRFIASNLCCNFFSLAVALLLVTCVVKSYNTVMIQFSAPGIHGECSVNLKDFNLKITSLFDVDSSSFTCINNKASWCRRKNRIGELIGEKRRLGNRGAYCKKGAFWNKGDYVIGAVINKNTLEWGRLLEGKR